MTDTKLCNTCKQDLPLSAFGKTKAKNTTNFRPLNKEYKGDCKDCLRKKAKAYRDANPNLWKKYKQNKGKQKDYLPEDRFLVSAIRARVTDAKGRDRKKGNSSTIDVAYMYNLWKQQKGKCALTDVDLAIELHSPLTLSIDKIDPTGIYEPSNVQWVVWAVNRAKGDLHTDDFIEMCKRVVEKCND